MYQGKLPIVSSTTNTKIEIMGGKNEDDTYYLSFAYLVPYREQSLTYIVMDTLDKDTLKEMANFLEYLTREINV